MRTVPSTPPGSAPAPRSAGRPSKFPSGEGQRVTIWVDSLAWPAAKARAEGEDPPRDRSDVVQELVEAYAEGRVRITKRKATR